MNREPAEANPQGQSILIVEDQTTICDLLAEFIATMPGFHVVGQAGSVAEALEAIHRLRPQVLTLDWTLPDGTGGEILQALDPTERPRVLVLSAETSDQIVREAMTAGALGFLEKTAGFHSFTEALKSVAAGQAYFGSAAANTVRRLVLLQPEAQISERERDVLKLVADGLSSREIADRLGLSLRTVENHRANISRRTGIRSVAQFTLLAARLGLIRISSPAFNTPAGSVS